MEISASDWFYNVSWVVPPGDTEAAGALPVQDRWLILGDAGGLGRALAQALERTGLRGVHIVESSEPSGLTSVEEHLRSSAGTRVHIVFLWALDSGVGEGSDGKALEHASWLSTEALALLVRSIEMSGVTPSPRLYVVTRGVTPVTAAPHACAQAGAWGIARTCALESPQISPKLIDLEGGSTRAHSEEAHLLQHELLRDDREDRVAYRGGERFVARVRHQPPAPAEISEPVRLRGDAAYLITGGAGNLGLRLAEWLVTKGVRSIVLSSRSESAESRKKIEELRAAGASVAWWPADVGNREDVAGLLAYASSRELPLRGVFHLAGTFDDHDLVQLDGSSLREVLRGRAHGAWYLSEMCDPKTLDFISFFSSAVSVLGSPGQGAYAASNAWLDALAHDPRMKACVVSSLNWGPWKAAGEDADDVVIRIDPAQGFSILEELLRQGVRQTMVLPYDLAESLRFFPRAGISRVFDELLGERSPVDLQTYGRPELSAEFVEPTSETERVIAALARRALALDRIGVDDDFFELGGDSIMAGGLLGRVSAVFGVELSLTDAVDALTVRRMALLVDERVVVASKG